MATQSPYVFVQYVSVDEMMTKIKMTSHLIFHVVMNWQIKSTILFLVYGIHLKT